MAENKNENMSAKTGHMLESMILSGELKIGSQLPTERELAEAMGVSKGIVHTAIAELSRKGFLRIVPRHGVYVADYTKIGTLDVLSAIASFNGGKIDRSLAESVIKTRLALEGVSVYELTMNHTGAQIARLRSLVSGIHSAVADGRIADSHTMAERLQELYLAISIMSGNQIIPIFVNASSELSAALTEKWVRSVGFDSILNRIDRAMDCIAAGDGLGAIKSVKSGCDEAIESLYR
jgi:GntR family transcriptional repressor for pyruvate dehydrogenase complex